MSTTDLLVASDARRLTLWLTMVPYPLRLARMDSDGLFAAYTYTFGMLPRPNKKRKRKTTQYNATQRDG